MDFLVPQTPLMWIQSLQSAPDFLCVRVADEGGLAHLTREQMLGFLKQATSGAPHGHSVPVKNSVVHHAEILGNTALVLITRVKDLGTAGNLCSTACFGRSTIPHGVSPENSSIKKPSPIGDDQIPHLLSFCAYPITGFLVNDGVVSGCASRRYRYGLMLRSKDS